MHLTKRDVDGEPGIFINLSTNKNKKAFLYYAYRTETTSDRDPPARDPFRQRPLDRNPQTETPLDTDPKTETPWTQTLPDRDPLEGTWHQAARQEVTSYRDPSEQTNRCKNSTLPQTSFAGSNNA